jgi:hypothetical protein
MRFLVLISFCFSVAITLLSAKSAEFSQNRDLPPLRLAAADLDVILQKAHDFIAAANGPVTEPESARESVKLGVGGSRNRDTPFFACEQCCVPKGTFQLLLYL